MNIRSLLACRFYARLAVDMCFLAVQTLSQSLSLYGFNFACLCVYLFCMTFPPTRFSRISILPISFIFLLLSLSSLPITISAAVVTITFLYSIPYRTNNRWTMAESKRPPKTKSHNKLLEQCMRPISMETTRVHN